MSTLYSEGLANCKRRTPPLRTELSVSGQQLSLPFGWSDDYAIQTIPGRRAFCIKTGAKFETKFLAEEDRAAAMRLAQEILDRERRHFYLGVHVLRPDARDRTISAVLALTGFFVDIDLRHTPEGYDPGMLPAGFADDAQMSRLAALLVTHIQAAGLPAPTIIVATGGGLCARWFYDAPVDVEDRARWETAETVLIARIRDTEFKEDGRVCRWPVDSKVCDLARVLRIENTVNPHWNVKCRVVWGHHANRADFESLATIILRYSTADVIAQVTDQRKKQVDKRHRKPGFDPFTGKPLNGSLQLHELDQAALILDEAARWLWVRRSAFIRALVRYRGGIKVGGRDQIFWVAALALAWSVSGGVADFVAELKSLYQHLFADTGWTEEDAGGSAKAVMNRYLRQLKDPTIPATYGLYLMSDAVFFKHLGVTPEERAELDSYLRCRRRQISPNAGAMAFPKMVGLSKEAYEAETKRRQSLSGARSSAMLGKAKQEAQTEARRLWSEGLPISKIATHLGVTRRSVTNYLKQAEQMQLNVTKWEKRS